MTCRSFVIWAFSTIAHTVGRECARMPGSQWQRNHGAVSFFSTEEFDREGLHGQLLMFMPFRVLGYADDTRRVYMANCLCSCPFVY